MSIYSMWGSSLIIAPAGFPVARGSAERGDDVHLCDSRVWWHWKQMPGEQLVFPVQKHGNNLPPALSHLLLFTAAGRTSDRQEPEMSPTHERMLEPRGMFGRLQRKTCFLPAWLLPSRVLSKHERDVSPKWT